MARWVAATLLSIIALQWLSLAGASHFRFGSISWAPIDSYSNTIDFTFRLAFRRSASSYHCDQSTIGNGSLLGSGGSWTATCVNYGGYNSRCNSNIGDTGFRCTDFSSNEDWSIGENNFTHLFPSIHEEWRVSYSSCCWISLSGQYGSSSWLVSTTVNLTRRSDNGRINSSPKSRSPAIVRWHEGCPNSLRIPVEDPDGDVVKCRFAHYSESYKYSYSFPYGTLDEETCVLTYSGSSGSAGTYVVALTLEDFPAGTTDFNSVSPFSAVGLQFLVRISSHSGSCSNIPVFTASTPLDGECSEVQIGSVYKTVIEVKLADFSKHIVEIVTSSPPGMQLTSLRYHGGVYYRNVTWSPSHYQVGQQSFCFKAVDSSFMGTEWRCVTILVGLSSTPHVITGSHTPRNPISKSGPGFIWWSIQFDRVIKKPRTSSYIRLVLLPNGHTVYKVDTISQYAVINSDHTTLQFAMPNAALSMDGSYAIIIDHGAVVGQGCSYDGPPTPGITNTSHWQFRVHGVCHAGYYLAPPEFKSCVDMNECGSHSRSKRSNYYGWWSYTVSTSVSPSISASISASASASSTVSSSMSASVSASAAMTNNCFNYPVGVADYNIIPDNQMTASTYHSSSYLLNPYYGRLNSTRGDGWCALTCCESQEWLQVDFGETFDLCGIAIQGPRFDRVSYVTAVNLTYSVDGSSWTTYLNTDSTEMQFHSNGNSSIVDQHKLPVSVSARYIRFLPTKRSHWNCLRVEVYGTLLNTSLSPSISASISASTRGSATVSPSISPSVSASVSASTSVSSSISASISASAAAMTNNCFNYPVGVADNNTIPDYQMTASTYYSSSYYPYYGRLNGTRGYGWCARTCCWSQEWLQVDLGKTFELCGVATQGHGTGVYYVTDFNLTYSVDGSSWTTYLNTDSTEMQFHSNGNGFIVDQHKLPVSVSARYIRFHPITQLNWNCLNVEVYGTLPSQIAPTSSSSMSLSHYASSSLYALPTPADFQLHVPAECAQICTNTPGSYSCSCISGYRLASDGKSCLDIDECSTNNGGCSHHCYNIPGSFYCGCPEGTTMAANNLTCVEPGVAITCNENNMTVSLERKTFPFFDVNRTHLRYSSCRATSNFTHVLITTPLNGCGTLMNETDEELIFWNEIQVDAVIIDNVITRTHDIKLPFYCSYSRRKMLTLSFRPRNIIVGSPEEGYGNFTMRMDFYKTAAFSTPYNRNDYPREVSLNENLYVMFSVESSADLAIMAENCKATKHENFYSVPQYIIIQNGCPRDTAMQYTYYPTRSFQQIIIPAFRFFNNYDVVYFHCELLACFKYNSNSRCSNSCLNSKRRKRREVFYDKLKQEESTSKYLLTSGPIMKKSENTKKSEKGDTGQSKQAAMIGGAAAAGGFGLIAVVALAVLFVKYRIARRLMNRNKVGDLYTTKEEQMSRKNAYIQEDDMIEKEDSF